MEVKTIKQTSKHVTACIHARASNNVGCSRIKLLGVLKNHNFKPYKVRKYYYFYIGGQERDRHFFLWNILKKLIISKFLPKHNLD